MPLIVLGPEEGWATFSGTERALGVGDEPDAQQQDSPVAFFSVALVACGLHVGRGASDVPLTIRPAVLEGRGRPDVLVLPRGSSELLHVALFIAAGSRDAAPPQAATIAAWLGRQNAERGPQTFVYPDATEFSLDCPKAELEDCVKQLARTVRPPTMDAAHVASLKTRLIDARRSAEATDPWRSADRLALRALLNSDASKTIPLGDANADAELTPDAVSRVFDELYAASPMLIVVVGDVAAQRVEESARSAFTPPSDGRVRRREPPTFTARSGVVVELDEHPRITLALATDDLTRAQAAAEDIRSVLERAGVAQQWEGHTWLVRGAAVALLRMQTRDPFAAIELAAQQLHSWRREGTPITTEGITDQAAPSRARRAALRWAVNAGTPAASAAGTAPARSHDVELGIGVIASAGRVDRVRDADPDAAARAAVQSRADAAFKAGLSPETLGQSGDADAHSAALRLDNGAHIALRREADEQVAVAIRYSCGARCDPPELHGRAALLATLTATACAGLSAEQLRERLSAMGADLRPYVDADSWGVTLQAPGARWQDAVAFAMDCALHPRLGRAELSEARLALRRRMGGRGAGPDAQARVAEAVMPTAPGALAPLGATLRQNSVSLNLLREFWAVYRNGASVSVAAVGPLVVDDALARVRARLTHLREGPPWQAARVAPEKLRTAAQEGAGQESGIVLWRLPTSPKGGGPGADGFAALMRARLMEVPGWVPVWHGGGTDREIGAWAAVAVHTPAGPQADRLQQLHATREKLAPGHLSFAASEAVLVARRRASALEGAPDHEASKLAGAPFDHEDIEVSLDAAQRVAAGLAATTPAWLPLR